MFCLGIMKTLESYPKINYGPPDVNARSIQEELERSSYQEYMKLKHRYDALKQLERNFNGEDLGTLNRKDLDSLEKQIDFSLKQMRSDRVNWIARIPLHGTQVEKAPMEPNWDDDEYNSKHDDRFEKLKPFIGCGNCIKQQLLLQVIDLRRAYNCEIMLTKIKIPLPDMILLAAKMPELLDYDKDLGHLEAASKIQLKNLAEEMQAVSKGLEKVELELTAAQNDGPISAGFQKVLKSFLDSAEAEVRSLISLYSEVGRNADSLSQYFGEDPARCPFEQVTQILFVFTKMFNKARDENAQQADAEKKKLEKEALKEQAAANASAKREDADSDTPKDIKAMIRSQYLSAKQRETRNGTG